MATKSILSPIKKRKCSNWLAAHGVHVCPLCQHKVLKVRDVVVAPVVDADTTTQVAHGLHMVVVECTRCLHLLFFDAAKIGLLGKLAAERERDR
jgi:hypothetical protein